MRVRTRSALRIFSTILITICISAAATAINAVRAKAKVDGLTLKAEAGFNGYAKEGKWIPVHITVENKGVDINEASLQVSYKDYAGIASIYSSDISLPINSRKELFIYVYYPQSGAANLKVDLVSNKKTVTSTNARVSNIAPQSLVIGLMTNTPSNYNSLSQITSQNGITRLVKMEPAALPDKAQGLETLDAIIVSDIDTGVLSYSQQKALELWIAKGGTLITIGGPKWQATVQGLQDLLPIQVSGTANVTAAPDISIFNSTSSFGRIDPFPEEVETTLATGKPANEVQILATQGDLPLVLERKMGNGKSVFLAADPGLEPYKNWGGTFIIYDGLLNFRHPQNAWSNGRWDINGSNEAISTIAELAIPSIFLICGLMAFYIVMVGPLNYIFLRIIKKREWAWISIPLIVIFVTIVSYVYGYLYRGRTPTLNRLTVIQAWDGVSQAEKDTLVGIYSPQRDTYSLEAENGFLLYPYNQEDINLKNDTAWFSIQDGQNANATGIPIEIGGMKVVGTTGTTTPLKLDHDLTISFKNGNAQISGTITNKSNTTISDINLVTPGRWKAIGSLAAGQSQKVDLPILTTTNSPDFFYDGATTILKTSYAQLQLDEELRRKEAFLRSVITPEYGENNSNWGIYLIGWLEGEQSSAALADLETKNTDTTLYIRHISPLVSESSSDITLTTALFEWQSSSDEVSPYSSYSYNTSEFTLRFRPAVPIQFSSVQSLKLNLDSYAVASTVEVSLWNVTLDDWDVIRNVNWGTYNVPDPERYVSRSGEVILRIKDGQNLGYVEMKKSAISLVVSP
jgi:hypothetical protein